MAGYAIEPVNAPLPTAWNFWFQSADGNQTSIAMSESLDGLSLAATRQNARGAVTVAFASSAAVPFDVGLNGPASTARASVMVAFGSESAASFSQAVAASSRWGCTMKANVNAHQSAIPRGMRGPAIARFSNRLFTMIACPPPEGTAMRA